MATIIVAISLALVIAGLFIAPLVTVVVIAWAVLGMLMFFYGPFPRSRPWLETILGGPIIWFATWLVHQRDG